MYLETCTMCLDDYTFKHSNVETMFQNIEMSSFCFDKGFEIFDMITRFLLHNI